MTLFMAFGAAFEYLLRYFTVGGVITCLKEKTSLYSCGAFVVGMVLAAVFSNLAIPALWRSDCHGQRFYEQGRRHRKGRSRGGAEAEQQNNFRNDFLNNMILASNCWLTFDDSFLNSFISTDFPSLCIQSKVPERISVNLDMALRSHENTSVINTIAPLGHIFFTIS